jgi:HSP20 family molecular chaperone IbpA
LQLFLPLKVHCPAYKPSKFSEWDLDSQDHLTVTVELPGVDQSTVSTQLLQSGSEIRVTGLRKISAQSLSCSPPNARFTKDKQHEVLEVLIPVPEEGDGERAEVETSSGQVQIFVPLKVRCTPRTPVQVSDWKNDSEDQLTLKIELSDVDKSTVRTIFNDDDNVVRVKGLREVTVAERPCLPPNAILTKDGRYEIFEVVVPLPRHGDVQKLQVDQIDGGLHLFMPFKKKPCPPYETVRVSDWELDSDLQLVADVALRGVEQGTVRVWADKDNSRVHIKAMRDVRKQRRECLPEDVYLIANGGFEVLKIAVDVPEGSAAEDVQVDIFDDFVRLYLPVYRNIDGILIEDDEYDWPEKNEDASEGFIDNQGVFREY